MKVSSHQIPFALSAEGKIVSIRDVERGLACNCICPACKAPLVAKKGEAKKKIWHFAHHADTACAGALETALHLAAKEIIADEKRLLVPPCCVIYGAPHGKHEWQPGVVCSNPFTYLPKPHGPDRYIDDVHAGFGQKPHGDTMLKFDDIFIEQAEGDIRPDLVGVIQGQRMYIEIAVTHFVDAEKLAKIRRRGVPTIEIQVCGEDGRVDWDSLRDALLSRIHWKYWLFNPVVEQIAEADYLQKEDARREALVLANRIRVDQHIAALAREKELRKVAQEKRLVRELEYQQRTQRIRDNASIREQETWRDVEEAKAALFEVAPSPELPIGRLPVLFLDYDAAAGGYGNRSPFLQQLEMSLRDRPCCIVVTSEIRYAKSEAEIAELFEFFGGRHVSCTPILDRTDPYGNRQREIDAWLANRNVTDFLVVNRAVAGFSQRPLQVVHGEACPDLHDRIWRWIESRRQ